MLNFYNLTHIQTIIPRNNIFLTKANHQNFYNYEKSLFIKSIICFKFI